MELFITNIVHHLSFHLILKQFVNLFQTTKNLLIIFTKRHSKRHWAIQVVGAFLINSYSIQQQKKLFSLRDAIKINEKHIKKTRPEPT